MEKHDRRMRWWGISCLVAVVAIVFPIGIQPAFAQDEGWPRQISASNAEITIYQPQLDSYEGDHVEGRAAVSVQMKEGGEPIFGAVWLSARVSTDRENRLVRILEVKVPKVRFADAKPEQEQKLISLLESEMPNWDMPLSLDRLLAAAEVVKKEEAAVAELRNDPPKIIFSSEPAVLVLIDGEPKLAPVENSKVMRVVNSPFAIFFDPETKSYYLNGGATWFSATDLKTWGAIANVPASVAALASTETGTTGTIDTKVSDTPPRIIAAMEPTELFVSEGAPQYSPLVGNDLMYMSNTDRDVFMLSSPQTYFVLISGRWYSSPALTGPWIYVAADKLPVIFAKIPADSPKADALAFVAGTSEAQDAVMDAEIPQTAAIQRNAAKLDVAYDGEAQFDPIEGTSLKYATNTSYSVISDNAKYYCCSDGVWYVSDAPTGPWVVADSVAPAIYTIPPSCPVYNVRYVRVYAATPEVVYVGYTPGYLGSYVYGPTVVYGTGYVYNPWYRTAYYPRPVTWGVAVRYNPWSGGWGFGVGYVGGRYRVSAGHAHGGASWVSGGWWGCGGYRGYKDAHVSNKTTVKYNHTVNVGDVNINRNNNNIYNRNQSIVSKADRENYAKAKHTNLAKGSKNNVLVDKNGDVFRKTDQGWQQRQGSKWEKSKASTMPEGIAQQRPAVGEGKRPAVGEGKRPEGRPAVKPEQLPAKPNAPGAGTRPAERPNKPEQLPAKPNAPGAATRPAERPNKPEQLPAKPNAPGAATRPAERPNKPEQLPAKTNAPGAATRPAERPNKPSQPQNRPSTQPAPSTLDRDLQSRQKGEARTKDFQKQNARQASPSQQPSRPSGGGAKSSQVSRPSGGGGGNRGAAQSSGGGGGAKREGGGGAGGKGGGGRR